MRSKKNKAVPLFPVAKATAQNYNQLNGAYQSCAPKASENLKEKIGTLLLALQSPLSQKQQNICWTLFEAKLRHYVDLKISGGQQL